VSAIFPLAVGLCLGFLFGMIGGLWGSIRTIRRNARLMAAARARIADQRSQIEGLFEMLGDSPHP